MHRNGERASAIMLRTRPLTDGKRGLRFCLRVSLAALRPGAAVMWTRPAASMRSREPELA